MRREHAETIALQALAWMAGDHDMLAHFCGATGVDGAELRSAAEDPTFLAGVLDFLMLDDCWVSAFAASAGVPPDAPGRARAALPGGALPHWT